MVVGLWGMTVKFYNERSAKCCEFQCRPWNQAAWAKVPAWPPVD